MMTKKRSSEKQFEISVEPHDDIILLKRKYALYWKVFEVKTVLPNCAAVKELTVTCITAGQRSFSKPVRSVYPVIQHGKPRLMK